MAEKEAGVFKKGYSATLNGHASVLLKVSAK
jgi:hypothetical protein